MLAVHISLDRTPRENLVFLLAPRNPQVAPVYANLDLKG